MGTGLRYSYRDQIVSVLDDILSSQADVLDAVRDVVATALAADKLIHVAGSGHSHLLAEEVFYRAGGIAAAQAILDPDLMLHMGAQRSTLLEREEGRAAKVLANYTISPGDVVFVASNSGRNAYPIELASLAHDLGAVTVALTSLDHSRKVSSRHTSGKKLHEITDYVISNCGEYGDAALDIPDRDVRMGPSSTLAGVFVLNAILAEAVAKLAQDGIETDVYQSANAQEAAGDTDDIVRRWRERLTGL